jgi:hypothetical protein
MAVLDAAIHVSVSARESRRWPAQALARTQDRRLETVIVNET